MKTTLLSLLMIPGISMASPATETKIKTVIQEYVSGYLNADSKLISKVFHPEVKLLSVDEGKLDQTTMSDWIKNLDERRQKQDIRTAQVELLELDVTGNAATAKLHLDFPKSIFTDYLSLLQIGGQWIIVGKIYEVQKK